MGFGRFIGLAAGAALAGCGAWIDHRADTREAQAEAQFPPSGQFVDVDGVQVHVQVDGASGPDVVLIHGASGNLRDMTFDLAGRLAERYRVFSVDRPGMGYSGRTDPEFGGAFNADAESPQEQARVLAAALRQLGAEAPIAVGHSYGGSVAMAWGVHEGASAVVSLAGAVMPWPGELGASYRILGSGFGGAVVPPFVTAFAGETQIDSAVQGIFGPQRVPDGYVAHVGAGLSLRRASLRANARQVNGLRPHLVRMSPLYPDLTIPVEFVHGDIDQTVPLQVHSQPAAGMIPSAELTVLPGVGHMPHHADPDAVVAAIDRAARRAGLR